jgi:hypothetical protein
MLQLRLLTKEELHIVLKFWLKHQWDRHAILWVQYRAILQGLEGNNCIQQGVLPSYYWTVVLQPAGILDPARGRDQGKFLA